MLVDPAVYECGRCGGNKITKEERVMCDDGHPRVAMKLVVRAPDMLFATSRGGRSRGSLHLYRNCKHINNVDDDEIIDREWWAFDDDQDVCNACIRRMGREVAA